MGHLFRRRTLVPLVFVGFVGLAAAHEAACNTYDESLLDPPPGAAHEPKNGVGWWSEDDDRGCFSAGAPRREDRPPPADPKDVGPITLALASMRLGSLNEDGRLDANAWKDIGFDLDGVCTASETCPSADPPPSCMAASSALPVDGNYCRDNTFGRLEYSASLVPELTKKYGLSDDAFNCALCVGAYNFVVRITGYNGEPNDDLVRIDAYPSPGLEKPLPWDCSRPDWKTHPCFQPDMPWKLERDTVTDGRPGPDPGPSKLFDDAAYVRDGYVFMSLPPDTLFWFPGYNGLVVAFPMRIRNGFVTGKLTRGADDLWRVTDGMIGGRAVGDDILRGFRLIGFCDTNDRENYDLMTTFVRSNLDVLGDGRSDPTVPCDAMSLGVAFSAVQARTGVLEDVQPLVECALPDGGADAASD